MTFDTETDISVVNQENKRDRDDRGNEQRIPRCYQMHPAKNKYPDAFVIRRSSGDFIDVFYLFMSLMYLSLFFLFCFVLCLLPCVKRFDEAFFICDLRDAEYKCRLWKESLPRVTPFYAVKSNPDPLFTRVLYKNGVKFDCSNQVNSRTNAKKKREDMTKK